MSLIQIRGGDDLIRLFEHTRGVSDRDSFEEAIMKIKLWLKDTKNEVFPKCRLFYQLPKGNKKLSNWYPEVLEHAQCPLEDYVERTAREAVGSFHVNSQDKK